MFNIKYSVFSFLLVNVPFLTDALKSNNSEKWLSRKLHRYMLEAILK